MRVCVQDKGIGMGIIHNEVLKYGKNIKGGKTGHVFADLDPLAVNKIGRIPGLAIKENRVFRPIGALAPEQLQALSVMSEQLPTYGTSQASLASALYGFRGQFDPPLTGSGHTICVLDTGVMKDHRGLVNKVVHEVNLTDSPSPDDVFSHGTGVAYLAAGGRHTEGEECGLSPGAYIMNIKVINDEGIGTTEFVVDGIEELIRLYESAQEQGLSRLDPMCPNTANMSFGAPDSGDPDDPIRVAFAQLMEKADRMDVFCGAGNDGPGTGTVLLPASIPEAWAIGAATFSPFNVWESSARGPVLDPVSGESIIKPDAVFFGVDIVTAASYSRDAFEVKSGTSFAAPCFAGGCGIMIEMADRMDYKTVDQRVYKPEMMEMLTQICGKAEGAPSGQDNEWGIGQPFGFNMPTGLGANVGSFMMLMMMMAMTSTLLRKK